MERLRKIRVRGFSFWQLHRFFVMFSVFFFSTFLFAVLLIPFYSRAQEQISKHIFDDAGYFSEEKAEKLESLCLEYGKLSDANIIMLIEDGIKSGAWKTFMEDFYDSYGADTLGNCAMLLLDVNEKERRIEIQGYGEMEYIITDSRIENIIDNIFDDLKEGKYYRALAAFPPLVKQYYDSGYGKDARTHTEEDNQHYDPYYYKNNTYIYFLFCIPVALVIGGIITGVMVVHSSGKNTTTFRNYMDGNRRNLIGRYDRYTHTTKSKRKKPEQNNSTHSSGGGGVSRGGNSHSGGGRSF